MRRVIVTALCAASFLFILPKPAHARWDWIDQLSGPGPFQGIDFQWRIARVPDDRADLGGCEGSRRIQPAAAG